MHSPSLDAWLADWDVRGGERRPTTAVELFHAAPGGVRTTEPFSTDEPLERRWTPTPPGGCIRDVAHAYTADGGLAVLRGNLAPDGAVIKTAGVAEELWPSRARRGSSSPRRRPSRSILAKQVQPGDVVVVRYEGPRGGPGMQEMLYPTSFLKGAGLGRVCALITDGRFSGGTVAASRSATSPPRPPPAA